MTPEYADGDVNMTEGHDTEQKEEKEKKEQEEKKTVSASFEPYEYRLNEADSMQQQVQETDHMLALSYTDSDAMGQQLVSYLGDVSKIDMERNLVHNRIHAGLYHGGILVCGKNGEVRVTHNQANTSTSINSTLTPDYFHIRSNVIAQYEPIKSFIRPTRSAI